MSKRIWIGILVCVSAFANAQNAKFLKRLDETSAVWYDENQPADQSPMNLFNFDSHYYSSMLLGEINRHRTQKRHTPFKQDSLLNHIAATALETFNRRSYMYRNAWLKECRSIHYALQRHQSENKVYAAYTFNVELIDLRFMEQFYWNRRIGTSDINLYHYKRTKIHDTLHEDYIAPDPMEAIKGQEFCRRSLVCLSKGKADHDFRSPVFLPLV